MIERKSIQETTGNKNSVIQSFYQNIFFFTKEGKTEPNIFDVPEFTTLGGTKDYYGQNPLAIFTNLVKPFIQFSFSGNTSSFGPNVNIIHDVYRVDWETFRGATRELENNEQENEQNQNSTTETIEETDLSGNVISSRVIKRDLRSSINLIKSKNDNSNLKFSNGGNEPSDINQFMLEQSSGDTINGDFEQGNILQNSKELYKKLIQYQLDNPIYSFTGDTTGITGSVYVFEPPQYTKKEGNYKTELFQDRCQYIIDTRFTFPIEQTKGLFDYVTFNPDTQM